MKNFRVIYGILLTGLLFSFIYSCKKEAVKTAPVVSITSVSNITATSASSGGMISSSGGATITAAGVCWSTNQNPTTSDSKTNDGAGSTSFSSALSGLIQGTTYYIKAYATNSVGTSYSSQLTFATLAQAPALTTTNISALTATSAASGGNITTDGGSPVTARGVCWGLTQNPTISDSKTSDGTGTGTFASQIAGLLAGKTYYVRAYATNSIGTTYGNQQTAVTTAALPSLTTTDVSNLSGATAGSGGNITNDGGSLVTARGVCWSVSENPTTADSKTSDSSGTGIFTSSMTGLLPGLTYYVKAYATNSLGTAYGNQVTVATVAILSTLTTTAVVSASATSATSGGNITAAGGVITARGVCWNTSENPTIDNSKTTDNTGAGSFTSTISGLSLGKTYYIRAYSTNNAGTAYGNQITYQNFVIGQSYQGGILAYVLKSGDPGYSASVVHGLIAANTDQSNGIRWSNGISVTTNATGTDLGTGFANTNTIISVQGPVATSYAAGLARAYNGGAYTDWFLPSRDELELLYNNIGAGASGTNKNIGGFAINLYYSSSEFGAGGAYYVNFSNGEIGPGLSKSTAIYVRAIRAF